MTSGAPPTGNTDCSHELAERIASRLEVVSAGVVHLSDERLTSTEDYIHAAIRALVRLKRHAAEGRMVTDLERTEMRNICTTAERICDSVDQYEQELRAAERVRLHLVDRNRVMAETWDDEPTQEFLPPFISGEVQVESDLL